MSGTTKNYVYLGDHKKIFWQRVWGKRILRRHFFDDAKKPNFEDCNCIKSHEKTPCKYEFQHSLTQLNSFLANVPILYPLKTQENSWFFSIFRRYEIGTLARNELKYINMFRKVSLTAFILLCARTLSTKTAYVLPSLVLNSNVGEYGPQPPPVVLSLTFTSYLVK